jgi:hypothetical protein
VRYMTTVPPTPSTRNVTGRDDGVPPPLSTSNVARATGGAADTLQRDCAPWPTPPRAGRATGSVWPPFRVTVEQPRWGDHRRRRSGARISLAAPTSPRRTAQTTGSAPVDNCDQFGRPLRGHHPHLLTAVAFSRSIWAGCPRTDLRVHTGSYDPAGAIAPTGHPTPWPCRAAPRPARSPNRFAPRSSNGPVETTRCIHVTYASVSAAHERTLRPRERLAAISFRTRQFHG